MKVTDITRATAAADIAEAINGGQIDNLMAVNWYEATDYYNTEKAAAIFEGLTDDWKPLYIDAQIKTFDTGRRYITEEILPPSYGSYIGKEYKGRHVEGELLQDGRHYVNLSFDGAAYLNHLKTLYESWANYQKAGLQARAVILQQRLKDAEARQLQVQAAEAARQSQASGADFPVGLINDLKAAGMIDAAHRWVKSYALFGYFAYTSSKRLLLRGETERINWRPYYDYFQVGISHKGTISQAVTKYKNWGDKPKDAVIVDEILEHIWQQ